MDTKTNHTTSEVVSLLNKAGINQLDVIAVQLTLLCSRFGVTHEEEVAALLLYAQEKVKTMASNTMSEDQKIDEFLKHAKGGEA